MGDFFDTVKPIHESDYKKMTKGKYSPDGPFNDPVVRCCECQRIIFREEIQKLGCCPRCSNRRVRNVLNLDDKEMQMLRDKRVDEDFLKLFGEINDF